MRAMLVVPSGQVTLTRVADGSHVENGRQRRTKDDRRHLG